MVVDTSVWSRAWRRRPPAPDQAATARLLADLNATGVPLWVPGIVLQELLSGVRTPEERRILEGLMDPFPIRLATREHHLLAASVHTDCRRVGVPATAVD